jgi:hypothetical protein
MCVIIAHTFFDYNTKRAELEEKTNRSQNKKKELDFRLGVRLKFKIPSKQTLSERRERKDKRNSDNKGKAAARILCTKVRNS